MHSLAERKASLLALAGQGGTIIEQHEVYFVLIPMKLTGDSNVNLRLCTGSQAGSPARPGARADLS